MNLVEALTRRSLMFAQSMARPYAEGAMNSLVLITRSGGFNDLAGEYDPTLSQVIYDDPDYPGTGAKAGVTMTTGPVTMDFGDEPQYFDNIQVMIPKEIALVPRIDDILRIMAGPDVQLTGRFYRVVSVVAGGRISPSNQLQCSGAAPSKQWVN